MCKETGDGKKRCSADVEDKGVGLYCTVQGRKGTAAATVLQQQWLKPVVSKQSKSLMGSVSYEDSN